MPGLLRHPDFPCKAITYAESNAVLSGGGRLSLSYVLKGAIAGLRLSRERPATRIGDLWRHTCFEAFVRSNDADAYYEFNLSPSTEWAAYAFDGYREGMRPLEPFETPRIEARAAEDTFALRAVLDLGGLPPAGAVWRVGLSAVIEETDGTLSYWALAHPAGKPDFHHPDCFALELPATERA